MGTITRPHTYTAGNVINPTEVTSNETTIYNEFNGNIDDDNVKAGAGIVASKLELSSATTATFSKNVQMALSTTITLGTTTQTMAVGSSATVTFMGVKPVVGSSILGLGWELIATATADNTTASIDFTSIQSSVYDVHVLAGNAVVPANDGVSTSLICGTSGGFQAGATDYAWVVDMTDMNTTPTATISGDNADTRIRMDGSNIGSDTSEQISFVAYFQNAGISAYTTVHGTAVYENAAGNFETTRFSGVFNFNDTVSVVTQIRFTFSAGNVESGNFQLFGVRKS